jgi:hypothetical protein
MVVQIWAEMSKALQDGFAEALATHNVRLQHPALNFGGCSTIVGFVAGVADDARKLLLPIACIMTKPWGHLERLQGARAAARTLKKREDNLCFSLRTCTNKNDFFNTVTQN